MIVHLYDPRKDKLYQRLAKSSTTLCGSAVGSTKGVILLKEFANPYYSHMLQGSMYLVHLTQPGRNEVKAKFEDRIIWSKWEGFWECELLEDDFQLCDKCASNEDFALLLLAQL